VKGRARSCGAATIVNAIAGNRGAAFAIDIYTDAEVELDYTGEVKGDAGDLDPSLIELCVRKTLDAFKPKKELGAKVETSSEIPVSRGLKSSSAAANASVLATLDAMDMSFDELGISGLKKALGLGVEAAVEAGVTVTGAYDDACASMYGGINITDNENNRLIKRMKEIGKVLLLIPEEKAESSSTDVERARLLKDLVLEAHEMALNGKIWKAMNLNGLAYCATLGFDEQIAIDALEAGAKAASLSGTGTAFAAIVDQNSKAKVKECWKEYGNVVETRINNTGSLIP